jgi:hypothetical protein
MVALSEARFSMVRMGDSIVLVNAYKIARFYVGDGQSPSATTSPTAAAIGETQQTPRRWRVQSHSSSASHACALLENNRVKCWGYSFFGQTGGPPVEYFDGFDQSLAVVGDNRQYGYASWARQVGNLNELDHNLPFVELSDEAFLVTTGPSSTCVVLMNNRSCAQCFGSNVKSILGLRSSVDAIRSFREDGMLP